MHSLSPLDGSATAVRNAAAGGIAVDDSQRLAVEREMDRVSSALSAQVTTLAQHMNGMLLVQALLLVSYLFVLLAGWSTPLPGKRWLLVALAGYALAALLLAELALRAQFASTGTLRRQLRSSEEVLERIAGRVPSMARGSFIAGIGRAASGVLPWLLAAGWVVLALYALALPPTAEPRIVSDSRAGGESRAAATSAAAPRQARAASAKRDAAVAGEVPVSNSDTATETESTLATLLRRATASSPSEAGERITP